MVGHWSRNNGVRVFTENCLANANENLVFWPQADSFYLGPFLNAHCYTYIHTKPTIVSVSQKAYCSLFYFYCVYDVVLLKSQMVWELWLKRFSEMGANFCNIVKNPCSVSFPFLLRKEWFFILLHFPKSLEKKPWFSLGTTRTLRKRRKKRNKSSLCITKISLPQKWMPA